VVLSLTIRWLGKPEQYPIVGNISLLDKDILNDFYFSNQYQMSDFKWVIEYACSCVSLVWNIFVYYSYELPINIELNTNDTNLCDNTTISSVCELIDQPKLVRKKKTSYLKLMSSFKIL
jgi:hypothetical protein